MLNKKKKMKKHVEEELNFGVVNWRAHFSCASELM